MNAIVQDVLTGVGSLVVFILLLIVLPIVLPILGAQINTGYLYIIAIAVFILMMAFGGYYLHVKSS
ncbi:MAG TPA: hypothetical protein VE134_01070 [Methanomicrobiales archaeon]|nr:hypothetical protein [Methanomicrobiales archaeon]